MNDEQNGWESDFGERVHGLLDRINEESERKILRLEPEVATALEIFDWAEGSSANLGRVLLRSAQKSRDTTLRLDDFPSSFRRQLSEQLLDWKNAPRIRAAH